MDLNKCLFLYSVFKAGSFRLAAEQNYLSYSAVAKKVALIEAELGFTVFNRSSKTDSLSLTVDGIFFMSQIEPVYEEANRFEESISSYVNRNVVIRIGILGSWKDMEKQYAGNRGNTITIQLVKNASIIKLFNALSRNLIDCGLIRTIGNDKDEQFDSYEFSRFSIEKLFSAKGMVCICNKEALIAKNSVISSEDADSLIGYKAVICTPMAAISEWEYAFDSYFERGSVFSDISLYSGKDIYKDISTIDQRTLFFMPKDIVQLNKIKTNKISVIPFEKWKLSYDSYFVTNSGDCRNMITDIKNKIKADSF